MNEHVCNKTADDDDIRSDSSKIHVSSDKARQLEREREREYIIIGTWLYNCICTPLGNALTIVLVHVCSVVHTQKYF